jgi:hypothetical protein
MGHTPAPWVIRDHTVGHPPRRAWIEIISPVDVGRMEHPICRIPSGFTNQEEDARLIAAAPFLLDKLREVAAYLNRHPTGSWPDGARHDLRDTLRSLIARAGGEPPP